MIKATYKLKVGVDEFELTAEVKDEKELFETMSFYTNLPKTAPKGATDLKMVFRTTKEGHKYYSIISESEKQEFKLGQNKEAQGGGLFCKGWEPLFSVGQETVQTGAVVVGAAVAQTQVQQAAVVAPVVQTQQIATPTIITQQAPAVAKPAVTVAPAPITTTAPAANPQVAKMATDVLARFKR